MKKYTVLIFCLLLIASAIMTGCGVTENAGVTPEATEASAATQPAATTGAGAGPVNYRFAVCGDNRTLGIDSGVFPNILQSAKAHGAAFLVNTGDVSNAGTASELTRYKELIDSSGLRVYTAPGNHDIGPGGVSDAYASIMGAYYFSFDYQGDHFIVLDNADDRTGIDSSQMQWFEGDLAAHGKSPHQFIFTHIPVADPTLPSGHVTGESGSAGLQSGMRLVEDAAKEPDVSDFFFGHIHAYFAYKLAGINAFITGGAGAPLYFPEGQGGYYHYLLVTVRQDGVDAEVVKITS